MQPLTISDSFVALDDSNGARELMVDANFWAALENGELGTFSRLISFFEFGEDWATWEKHPLGDEFVLLIEGAVELVLESKDATSKIEMGEPCSFVIIPRDVWHTANVRRPAKMLFVTPGEGTEIRPR